MQEGRRGEQLGAQGPPGGDISGARPGRFTDWDNPEDAENAPQGYYDEDQDDDSYIPDEHDPDYDLSEGAGYAHWEPARATAFPRWLIVAASLLLILAILVPVVIQAR